MQSDLGLEGLKTYPAELIGGFSSHVDAGPFHFLVAYLLGMLSLICLLSGACYINRQITNNGFVCFHKAQNKTVCTVIWLIISCYVAVVKKQHLRMQRSYEISLTTGNTGGTTLRARTARQPSPTRPAASPSPPSTPPLPSLHLKHCFERGS